VCNKDFTRASHLTKHKLIHAGITIKNHVCDVCNKAFSQASDMKKHRETHTSFWLNPKTEKIVRVRML
jgi:KRAB domain-containing zinc finger protein